MHVQKNSEEITSCPFIYLTYMAYFTFSNILQTSFDKVAIQVGTRAEPVYIM